MILPISNHALYKGAMFISKEELNMSMRMLTLNEKFGYRIRRLNKTRFKVLCKDI